MPGNFLVFSGKTTELSVYNEFSDPGIILQGNTGAVFPYLCGVKIIIIC
jgi:hypothetical protein